MVDCLPKYIVSSYDDGAFRQFPYSERDPALTCAHEITDQLLASMNKAERGAEPLYVRYRSNGEVPSIFNDEGMQFDANPYVFQRIREFTGESDSHWFT